MPLLPDYLDHGLSVVFCGTAVGLRSAARGHYAGNGNEFWQYVFQAGLTPHQLAPADDASITSHGIGLTDLAKHVAASKRPGDLLETSHSRKSW